MTANPYDYLIIGQGLAGSILADCLIKRGSTVFVLDNHHQGSSSMVAAGIINPVTGHRLNITEGFETFFPVAKQYYKQAEQSAPGSFWRDVEQTRLVKNQGQSDYYHQRRTESAYQPILGDFLDRTEWFADSAYGSTQVLQSAVVNSRAFLAELKQRLKALNSYAAVPFEHQQLEQVDNYFRYSDHIGKRLIFCEGYQAINNPWLEHLPFKLAKGEILTVSTEQLIPNQLLNWGSWLVSNPQGDQARLGASFVWNDISPQVDAANEAKLLASLETHTTIKATHLQTDAGIRPTTEQRKPFIGSIPSLPGAYCFNGFGSKGCLLIPYYAELLCEHLFTGAPLPQELSQFL
ncbi:MAG: FAD-dependent oxidoreductase [Pseudomonadota bacterium]